MATDTDKRERLTPEEAREVVERIGSKKGAARHLGVPRSTFYHWLHPERGWERGRRYYAANRERVRLKNQEHYRNMTGLQIARKQLTSRRAKALTRMAERNRTEGVSSGAI